MVRRLFYLFIALDLINMPSTCQLISAIFTNMANLIYLAKTEPRISREDRRIELFNEFLVGLTFDALLTVTDWA